MDHLPPIAHPYNPIRVPYYGEVYSGHGDILDNWGDSRFPESAGWTEDFIASALHNDESSVIAFLQACLYFGPLQEVLLVPDPVENFTRFDEADGSRWIDSSKLPHFCWVHIRRGPRDSIEQEKNRKNLEGVIDLCRRILEYLPEKSTGLVISINVLLECICSLHNNECRVVGNLEGMVRTRTGNFEIGWLESSLSTLGWCKKLLERVGYLCGVSGKYFLFLTGPVRQSRSHQTCTGNACTAYNVSDGLLPTHNESCCTSGEAPGTQRLLDNKNAKSNCRLAGPDMLAVSKILDGGSFPLLYVRNSQSKIQLRVVPWQQGMPYVAISHV